MEIFSFLGLGRPSPKDTGGDFRSNKDIEPPMTFAGAFLATNDLHPFSQPGLFTPASGELGQGSFLLGDKGQNLCHSDGSGGLLHP